MGNLFIRAKLILVIALTLTIPAVALACAAPATPTPQPPKPPAAAATKAPQPTAAPAATKAPQPAATAAPTKAPEAAKPAEPPKPAAKAEPAKPPVEMKVGHNRLWANTALLVGINKGMFDSLPGVKVVWSEFNDTVKITEALASGELAAGAVAMTGVLTAVEKGVKVKAVALLSGHSDPTNTYFVRRDSGIDSVKDLKGKKIGVTQIGGSFDLYLRWMLEKNGLNPDKDVEIVVMAAPASLNAVIAKQLDMTAQSGAGAIQIKEQYDSQLKPLFSFRDVDPELAKGFNSLVLTMPEDFINKNRAAAKAFLKAYVQAARFTNANPQEAKQAWATTSGNQAVLKMTGVAYVPDDAKIDIGALDFDIKVAKRFGYMKKDISPTQAVDHSLLDEVLAGR